MRCKNCYIHFLFLHIQIIYLFDLFLFVILFYRQFRICITNALGKAHTPKDARVPRLSLWESSRDSG